MFHNLGFHPEKKEDEVWVTSVKVGLFHLMKAKTKKAGTPDEDDFVPVFIAKSEFEEEMALV